MKSTKHSPPNKFKEAGQGFVEYAIILVFVGIAVVLVVSLMQPAIGDVFSRFVAQAPVAPPSLLNYTPPPTFTTTPTVDPNASPTPIPSITLVPSNTPTATNTPVPSNTPTSTASNTPTATVPCAYPPHTVPAGGTVRVQIENFRCGGAGVAFFEAASSGGPGSVDYRSDVGIEGPDLENTSDAGGGFNVGWVGNGEWIEYEVVSTQTVAHSFVIRNASISSSNPRIRVTVSQGALQFNSQVFTLGPTNGWQDWTNDTIGPISLFNGTNIVRITMETGLGNYNYFDIQPYAPTATPTPVTPTASPVPTNTPSPTNTPVPVTLTLYSNDDHDGYVRENNFWNVGDVVDDNDNYIIVGDYDDFFNEQYKGFVSFNTSAIPANATITSVQLRLQQRNGLVGSPFGDFGLGVLYADIASPTGFSGSYTLQASDFESGSAADNVITLSATSGNNQWSTGNLGASFFNLINRTGYTQFRIHFEFPDDGDRDEDQFQFDSSDSGQNNQPPAPELIITYTVP